MFLLPFILLFALHNALGLSDALMASVGNEHPGRDSVCGMEVQTYNLIMCFAFMGGIVAFWTRTAYLFGGSKNKNRVFIFAVKTLFAGLFWAAVLLLI